MALIRLNSRSAPASTFGNVLQVKHAESNAISTHAAGIETFSDSNLTINFTPTATTSKLLINVAFIFGADASAGLQCRIKKIIGGVTTFLFFDNSATGNQRTTLGNIRAAQNVAQGNGTFSTIIEDSPSTTSAITYTLQGCMQASSGNLYINSRNDALIDCDRMGHITITEIAG